MIRLVRAIHAAKLLAFSGEREPRTGRHNHTRSVHVIPTVVQGRFASRNLGRAV